MGGTLILFCFRERRPEEKDPDDIVLIGVAKEVI